VRATSAERKVRGMNDDLRAYRLEQGVTLQEVADELGKHGPTWLWKREHGEVEVTPAEARLIRAAIDLIAERKQTRIGGGRTR
jgi:transcriptional regulator with XRE-family HTH domain